MPQNSKAMSLFANVGIAETYLSDCGIDIVVANEIDPARSKFYQHLYPETVMVEGDIKEPGVQAQLLDYARQEPIDLIMATPPCQGMSTAGKKDQNDERNFLITYAVKMVQDLKPKYVFLENVPEQLRTSIPYQGTKVLIPDYVQQELGKDYNFNDQFVMDAEDYSVPQTRERAIMLLTRKDLSYVWQTPPKHDHIITMAEAIGDLSSLDPEVHDLPLADRQKLFPDFEQKKAAGLKVSPWHYPPRHIHRQVVSLMHTPTGETAFHNIDQFKPRKQDGTLVKGFKNTYKRQAWDRPGYTITMYNRTIGSQNNVHPGRYLGKDQDGFDIYSDARVLTVFELMRIMSLPDNWNIPSWASEHFVRQVIGEGIPPMLVKNIMQELVRVHE